MKRILSTVVHFFIGAVIGIGISLCFTGCGARTQSVPKTPVTEGPVAAQLNDTWNESFPSEAVKLSDTRYFKPPSAVQVVQGSAQCWNGSAFYTCTGPEKTLRARIVIGALGVCEYRAADTTMTTLALQDCGGIASDNETQLPQGTVIELQNYDAPGQLLEVQFFLHR